MGERQPRGPTGLPVVGSSLDFAADPLAFMERCAREYGDLVRVNTVDGEVYLLTDPEGVRRVLAENDANYRKPDFGGEGLDGLLGDGLLTSDGDLWLNQRKRIQPAFRRAQLDRYAESMVANARALAETWRDGDRVNVDEAASRLTLRIIVETVLGARLDGLEREISDALRNVGPRFRSDDVRALVPEAVPTPRNLRYRLGERRLDRVVRDIVRQRERRASRPGERGHASDGGVGQSDESDQPGEGDKQREADRADGDMLSLLLRAREAGAAEVDDEQLRDEVLTMLLAGHDTTALALTYSWYLLSENPAAERSFHDELDAVLGDDDPTAEDAADLTYTEAVVKEAMRLYPPAYTIFRESKADDTVAGFHLPGGSVVSMPQWVVHRDPRWWDDPEQFRPERWLDESGVEATTSDRPDYAYYPFGGGPRRCIGGEFATREAKLVLATVGRRFALDYAGSDEPELVPMVTLHPEPPVEFDVRAR